MKYFHPYFLLLALTSMLFFSCKKDGGEGETDENSNEYHISFKVNGEQKRFKQNVGMYIGDQADADGAFITTLQAYDNLSAALANYVSLSVLHGAPIQTGKTYADPNPPVPGHNLTETLFSYTGADKRIFITMGAFAKFAGNPGMHHLDDVKFDSKILFTSITEKEARGTFSAHVYHDVNNTLNFEEAVLTEGSFFLPIK